MEEIINQLYQTINTEVDELGTTFDDREILIFEGTKVGIPRIILPKLKRYLQTYPDSDKKWFAQLVCSG